MITISRPYTYINTENGNARLEAVIADELLAKEYRIWYEVKPEYGDYLCSELADAFVLAVLPTAANSEQDICVHANISPELFYNTLNTHIPFYAEFLGRKRINITADSIKAVKFSGTAVATGCSMGVDSLSTIYQHTDENCLPEYRLTHLTLFNSGQLGNVEQDIIDTVFEEACGKAELMADELGLEFVPVNTNITSIMADSDLVLLQLFNYYTLSCVLALQKLFGKYFLASCYSAENICIDPSNISRTAAAVVPLMGSENTEVILSDTFRKRTEKTELISHNELTPEYIDVCWANSGKHLRGGRTYYAEEKTKRNCGWCDKCMRTLMTFELLGCLEDYGEAFDLKKYMQHRKDYIVKVVANAKFELFYDEIYQMMKERKFKIPPIAYIAKLLNRKDSRLVLWLWQTYNTIKRKRIRNSR